MACYALSHMRRFLLAYADVPTWRIGMKGTSFIPFALDTWWIMYPTGKPGRAPTAVPGERNLMQRCRRCQREIVDDATRRRTEWCTSIRRLLKLGAAQPEDYHQRCFIDAILDRRHAPAAPPHDRPTDDSHPFPFASA